MGQIWQVLLAPLDKYCERIDASFWSEPLNFLSNIAFLIVAIRLYFLAANSRLRQQKQLRKLAFVAGAVGIGSGFFHSVPNLLTQTADVLPIAIFVGMSLLFYFKQLFDENALRRKTLYLVLGSLVLFPLLAKLLSLSTALAGGEAYLGIIPGLFILIYQEQFQARRSRLILAAGAFTLAYLARSLDPWICESFPYGTHFIWHLLTATVAYLIASLQLMTANSQAST